MDTGDVVVECKYTDSGQYVLKSAYLEKLRKDAARAGKTWAMEVWFSGAGTRVCVVSPDVLDWYVKHMRKERNHARHAANKNRA